MNGANKIALSVLCVSYDDNNLIEFNAQVGWESEIGLGIEAGYRAVQIELATFDDIDNADIDVAGPYAVLTITSNTRLPQRLARGHLAQTVSLVCHCAAD